MFCSYCGAYSEEDARFCQECGNPLSFAEYESNAEFYDPNPYGWKYGYQYLPYSSPVRTFRTFFWPNVFSLFLCSPVFGFLGVLASRQASFAAKMGWNERAWKRSYWAELFFWVGLAVGIVWSLIVSIQRFDELLATARLYYGQ